MQKVLVSRCLLGHLVRYDGGSHGPFDLLSRWHAQGGSSPFARRSPAACRRPARQRRSPAARAAKCWTG